jgi:ABC-type branched-subunit amino acid transport system substrate-binding protein
VALVATVTLALGASGGLGVGIAAAQSGSKESLEATDVGITDKEIRIAVIADVDNPFQAGLFKGPADSVAAWGKWINKNGGLAGRKVVVDFIDSKLNADETRNAIITACAQDFAIVGTAALFVNNADDLVGCKDAAGTATGIPDFPVVTTEPVHQCSPVSHPVNPPTLDCASIDQNPQTYRAAIGSTFYYLKKYKDLHGAFLYPSDLRAAKDSQVPAFSAQEQAGIAIDVEEDVSARAPQSAYTPIVQQMKDKSSTYARSGLGSASTVSFRKEAKLQGLNSVKVWDCTVQCYNGSLLEQGGADMEGQYVSMNFVPFEESRSNKMVANYLKSVGKANADGFGAQAWAAATYFRDAVNAVVKSGGNNALTRERVLEAADGINGFTAEGMVGKTDVGRRVPSACFALLQVKDGKFVRVFPTKKATFNCDAKNLVTLKLDLLG